MKARAVEKARARLKVAEDAVQRMKESDNPMSEFETNWYAFLAAQNSVFSILEQGAKSGGASKGWFDGVKHHRKSDPLLRYLHHARNSDEHSIEGNIERHEMELVSKLPGTKITPGSETKSGQPHIAMTVGQPVDIKVMMPGLRLVAVTDRNVVYAPPNLPRDQQVGDNEPLSAAEACLSHLRRLLAEAERLAG